MDSRVNFLAEREISYITAYKTVKNDDVYRAVSGHSGHSGDHNREKRKGSKHVKNPRYSSVHSHTTPLYKKKFLTEFEKEVKRLKHKKSVLTCYINTLNVLGAVCFIYGMVREIVGFMQALEGFKREDAPKDYIETEGGSTIIPVWSCVVLMLLGIVFSLCFYSLFKRKAYRICFRKFSIKWILWLLVPVCVGTSVGFSMLKIPSYTLVIVPALGIILQFIAGFLLKRRVNVKEAIKNVIAKENGPSMFNAYDDVSSGESEEEFSRFGSNLGTPVPSSKLPLWRKATSAMSPNATPVPSQIPSHIPSQNNAL